MDKWVDSLDQVFVMLLGNPGSGAEKATVIVAALLAMFWVLAKAGAAFGIPNTGIFYSLVTGGLGIAFMVVAMAAAKLYLPLWSQPEARIWILASAGALVSLVLVVPLMCAFQRAGYLAALPTWLLGLGAAAGIILLVGASFDLVVSGARDAGKGAAHKADIERVLE